MRIQWYQIPFPAYSVLLAAYGRDRHRVVVMETMAAVTRIWDGEDARLRPVESWKKLERQGLARITEEQARTLRLAVWIFDLGRVSGLLRVAACRLAADLEPALEVQFWMDDL